MGWYCQYNLVMEPFSPDVMKDLFMYNKEVPYIIDEEGNSIQETSTILTDIIVNFSRHHPTTLFTVFIEGWSGNEKEVAYIRNGKTQYEVAILPPFNPSNLE